MSTYVQAMAERLAVELPGLDPQLADLYLLLALTKGSGTSLEDVHDAWAVWRTTTRPDHPDLVPFAELTTAVQERDRKYRDGVRRAAEAVAR